MVADSTSPSVADSHGRIGLCALACQLPALLAKVGEPHALALHDRCGCALREAAPDTSNESLLIAARWPTARERDPRAEAAFADLAALVRGVRGLRTEAGTPASAWAPLTIEPSDDGAAAALRTDLRYLEALARVRS